MIIKITLLIFLLFSNLAYADDSWTGPDKTKHIGISFVLGVVASDDRIAKNKSSAFMLALIPGVIKEIGVDGKPSYKDMLANISGVLIGIEFSDLRIRYGEDEVSATYQYEF